MKNIITYYPRKFNKTKSMYFAILKTLKNNKKVSYCTLNKTKSQIEKEFKEITDTKIKAIKITNYIYDIELCQ